MTFGLFLIVVACLIHFPGFESPMMYDSGAWILAKAPIFAHNDPLQVIGLAPGRPLFMLTLYLNYIVDGMDPFLYRVVNALILALTGLALTVLATLVLETPVLGVEGNTKQKRLAAAFVGLLFVVHPLQSFVVLYVWQRAAIMACFFYFASLAVYLAVRSGRSQQPVPAYLLVAILFLGAILSKENAATLPFVLFLSEITLFRSNIRRLAKQGIIVALIALPPLILYVLALHYLHGTQSATPPGFIARLVTYYEVSHMSLLQVFMTQCRVLFSYLSMILSPGLFEVHFVRAEVISTSFWNPPSTPFAVIGFVGLLGLGLAAMRRLPILSFGILFYLVTLAPEAYLIPKYLFAGYRPILPMGGVLLVLSWAVLAMVLWSQARSKRAMLKSAGLMAGGLVLVLITAQTVFQARNWNPHHFWQEAYRRLPVLSNQVEVVPYLDTLINYSHWLIDSGEYDKAIAVLGKAGLERSTISGDSDYGEAGSKFEMVIKRNPDRALKAMLNLAFALQSSGDSLGASSAYEKAARIGDQCGKVWYKLGLRADKSGSPAEAVKYYEKAVKVAPGLAQAWLNLGLALKRMGKLPQAIRNYEKAVSVDPKMGRAYNNLGLAWEEAGNIDKALSNYSQALTIMPDNRDVNFNFGNALIKSGNLDEAVRRYRKALEIDPGYSKANANLGVALLRSGRFSEAVVSLKQALLGDGKNAELHNTMGVALAELGQKRQALDHFKKALSLDPDNAGARQNLERLIKKMDESSTAASLSAPHEAGEAK